MAASSHAKRPAHGLRQEDGAIAVIVALLMTMLLGMGALAIDVASFRLTQRQLQAATDAAALAGTYALTTDTGPTDPQTWVNKYLGINYHGAGTATAPNAQTGTYCPGSRAVACEPFYGRRQRLSGAFQVLVPGRMR